MKRITSRLPLIVATMTLLLMTGGVLAQSGRPKVLVLRPETSIEDVKVIEKFQWDLADALDKSGKFDIVKKGEYEDAMKALNLNRDAAVPDSLISSIMDTLQAAIYARGSLDQPGGKKTQISAKIDYTIPRNDFTIEGKEVSVASEDQVGELARQATGALIDASERISLSSIARSYYNSAIYDKAIENYEKLLALAPEDINVHYMVGLSYLKAENKETAFTKFHQILSDINPDHIATLEILASTNFADENFEEALKYYSKLAEVKPDNYDYTRYWAFSLQKLGRDDEAMGVYEKLVMIRDDDSGIRNMMGYNYYVKIDPLTKNGDSTAARTAAKNAITHLARSLELDKEASGIDDAQKKNAYCQKLFLLGRSQVTAGQTREALVCLGQLIEMDPNYQYANYYMGQIAYDQKRFAKAVEYFNKEAEVGAESMKGSLYQRIGRIYDKELGNFPKAIEAYTKAIPALDGENKNLVRFMRGAAHYDFANQLDYANDQEADMDQLIQDGKMTISRADQALSNYDSAETDLKQVTGRYAKSAQDHINNIAQLRDRLNKIKLQISYYDKTK